jgi:DNA-binding GntR family transcriptional regulator
MNPGVSTRPEDLGRIVERVRGEFNEMPGMQLTEAQAARLWGLEPTACRGVVERLVGDAFLRRTPNGRIVRAGQ